MLHPDLTPGDLAICREAIAPLRTEPRHAAEQGSELLFGERVTVRQIDERRWAQVEGESDGYLGWLPASMLTPTAGLPPEPWPLVQPLIARVELDHPSGYRSQVALPRGARFPTSETHDGHYLLRLPDGGAGPSVLRLPTDALGATLSPNPESILRHALHFLGAPYRWGGRTALGIDCSGLTQIALALHGIPIPRDSWQQAEAGTDVPAAERRPADLAFFASADAPTDRVTHVAFVLDADHALHASGLGHVRIDPLSAAGIHRATPAAPLSHRLIRVKRVLP
jgi:cell wall-associated NlpC family hydrolase